MTRRNKRIYNLILIISAIVLLILDIPQPYGTIALSVLGITLLVSWTKTIAPTIVLYILGLGGSLLTVIASLVFTTYTGAVKLGDRFDVPTAVRFESDFETAIKKAKTGNKPVFIDFYVEWCSPCLNFTKNVLTDKKVGRYMNMAFVSFKCDAEKGEGIELAGRYNIKNYPTLLIVDAKGNAPENVLEDVILPKKKDLIRLSKKYIN